MTNPAPVKIRQIIRTEDDGIVPLGYVFDFQGDVTPVGYIFYPNCEPIEIVKERHPKLYDRLVEMGWTQFADLRSGYTIEHTMSFVPVEDSGPLDKILTEIQDALEYYAHPDHYEENYRLSGLRPPGVLVERGGKARRALGLLQPLLKELESE